MDRWEDSREALASIDYIIEENQKDDLSRSEIIQALRGLIVMQEIRARVKQNRALRKSAGGDVIP